MLGCCQRKLSVVEMEAVIEVGRFEVGIFEVGRFQVSRGQHNRILVFSKQIEAGKCEAGKWMDGWREGPVLSWEDLES